MPWPKGKPRHPGTGRKKGGKNKITKDAKEVIFELIRDNAPRLQQWLDEVARDPEQGPAAAIRLYSNLAEYVIPKTTRTEVSGVDGAPIEVREREASSRALALLQVLQQRKLAREPITITQQPGD